uniref:Nonstructural protein n=1 Tax=Parvoviridae sp. TaxID=1940570 RepID=A0A893A454_9VIRU|nr:MAG: nonstructural protein [Parvoviridae sp.]
MNDGVYNDLRRDFGMDIPDLPPGQDTPEPTGSGVLDNTTQQDRRTTDAGLSGGRTRNFEDIIQACGKLLNDEQRSFIRETATRCHAAARTSNGIWLQDVILAGSDERAQDLSTFIQGRLGSYTRSVFLTSVHDGHVHILHDCAYAGRVCRCKWKKEALQQEGTELRRRPHRLRGRGVRELTLSDWVRILLYFSTEGRHQKAPYINGKVQTSSISTQDLAKQRLERPRRENSELAGKEEQDLEGNTDDLRALFETGEVYPGIRGCGDEVLRGTKRKRQEDQTIFSQLQLLLAKYPVSPLINIVDHPVYLESKLASFRSNNGRVQDAVDVFSKKLMRYTISDFHSNIYSKSDCVPIFSAGHIPVDEYYYDIDDSLDVINKLLLFQFDNSEEYVCNFLEDVYNIVDRNYPKCNCLIVKSPPSAGKNYFFDMICDYLLCKGQLGSANKHNQFAFQEAYGKRIIMWNEPNYEGSMTDQLKMMTAGDSYVVRVKCKPDAAVYKTPMIVLTNKQIALMNDSAFADRIKKYNWKAAPFLKDCKKKPYPLAFYSLLKQYGLIKE